MLLVHFTLVEEHGTTAYGSKTLYGRATIMAAVVTLLQFGMVDTIRQAAQEQDAGQRHQLHKPGEQIEYIGTTAADQAMVTARVADRRAPIGH